MSKFIGDGMHVSYDAPARDAPAPEPEARPRRRARKGKAVNAPKTAFTEDKKDVLKSEETE